MEASSVNGLPRYQSKYCFLVVEKGSAYYVLGSPRILSLLPEFDVTALADIELPGFIYDQIRLRTLPQQRSSSFLFAHVSQLYGSQSTTTPVADLEFCNLLQGKDLVVTQEAVLNSAAT